jgi:hypothetical protein
MGFLMVLLLPTPTELFLASSEQQRALVPLPAEGNTKLLTLAILPNGIKHGKDSLELEVKRSVLFSCPERWLLRRCSTCRRIRASITGSLFSKWRGSGTPERLSSSDGHRRYRHRNNCPAINVFDASLIVSDHGHRGRDDRNGDVISLRQKKKKIFRSFKGRVSNKHSSRYQRTRLAHKVSRATG